MTPASMAQVHVSTDADGVGWVVLDNPNKYNAMSLSMWQVLSEALTRFEADAAVRCVVLRGQGDKAFCSGADISQFETARSGPEANAEYERITRGTMAQVQAFPKPTLAMISGFCLGGGVALAMNCDIRIAAAGSRFGIPAARLGIGYHYAAVKALTDLVGPAMAKQILFTGDRFPAEEALRIGLVNELTAADALEERVRSMARGIAVNAPLSIAAAKLAVTTATSDATPRDLDSCREMERACIESEDHKEGRRAFMEKRTPVFRGL
jgi:enoyl-CoA hydratase/carnithine racemase